MILGGNIPRDGLIELYRASLPTPASLTIAPSAVTITTGTTVAFLATDDLGRPRYDATWTVSDPGTASLTVTANGASLTGLTLGQVTLTATSTACRHRPPSRSRRSRWHHAGQGGPARRPSAAVQRRRRDGAAEPARGVDAERRTLAGITPDSSPVLTALVPGQVTLTATVLGVTMTAEVTILEGTTYPQGTVLWTAPVTPGFVPTGIVQTVMFDPDNTATYTVQQSTGNPESLVQAFTKDGRQVWERRLRPLLGEPVSDGAGGLLVTEACDSENPVQLLGPRSDDGRNQVVYADRAAVRRDRVPHGRAADCHPSRWRRGVLAPPNALPSFMVVSEWGGGLVQPWIPQSTVIDMFGSTFHLPATMGAPIVDGDGVIYVQYAVRQIPYPATSIASQLYLLKILPDGTTSTVELGTSTEANLFPGSLLPDGNGGVLSTWTVVKIRTPSEPEPYKAAHLSSAGTILNTYTMPSRRRRPRRGRMACRSRRRWCWARAARRSRGTRTTSRRSTSRPAQRTGTTWPGERSRSSATMPPPA